MTFSEILGLMGVKFRNLNTCTFIFELIVLLVTIFREAKINYQCNILSDFH